MSKNIDILSHPYNWLPEIESLRIMSLNPKEKHLQELLEFTLTKCMNALEAQSGSIFLYDNKAEELILRIVSNGGNRPLEGIRQALGEGVAGVVALHREPVVVEDISKDSRFLQKQRFQHYRTNSFLSAPLEFSGELLGVVNITERQSNLSFNNQDLKLLSELCGFLAFFLYQSRRYFQEQEDESVKFAFPGRLATGLIHELNNPLDGIIRYINLSLNCLGEESIIKEYLMESKRGLNRIVKIIRSLLDFGRNNTYAPQTVDINKTVDESLFLLNYYFLSGKIKLFKRLQRNLPVVQDHGLKLVFTNILKNACDAIGQEQGRIEVSSMIRNGFIDIKISDTGPGIPEELQHKIFEPFFTTKEMGKGSGLGLAICLNIIEKYRGCILLDSKQAKGTTFTIRLPHIRILQPEK